MKTFLPFGIAGLIFLISTGLYAQNAQIRPETTNQVTGCRLQVTGLKAVELSPGEIGQRVEPTSNYELRAANYDNSGKDLSCHLMMNPAMVGETEEAIRLLSKLAYADEVQGVDGAQKLSVQKLLDTSSTGATKQFAAEVEVGKEPIEKFIIGEPQPARTHSINPSVECASGSTDHQSVSNCAWNNNSELPSSTATAVSSASFQPIDRIVAEHQESTHKANNQSSSSYITRAAKALVSCLLYSPVSYSTEFSNWSPHTAIQPLLATASSPGILGVGAMLSILPQAHAADESFSTYYASSASSTNANGNFYPTSITTNTDGSYIVAGTVFSSPSYNALLGFDANGVETWYNEQSSSLAGIAVSSTTIMNNELFSGCYYTNNNTQLGVYISQNNTNNGDLLSAWGFNISFTNPISIFPTSQNTLIAFAGNYGLEFNPSNGTVLSTVTLPSYTSINSAAAISDSSYVVGGSCSYAGAPGSCLSQISLTGTNWSSGWTRVLNPSTNQISISSIAARDNTVIFGGTIGVPSSPTDGFIGSLDAITGASSWVTSIGGTEWDYLNSVIFASSDLNNTNQIMAVGTFNNSAWYVLMDLNETLSKSVILEGLDPSRAYRVVANNDGTFTSVGNTGYTYVGSDYYLMFAILNENLEINSCLLLPEEDFPGANYNDNTLNIQLGGQNITNAVGSPTSFSASYLTATNITSQFSKGTGPIIQSYQSSTCPPTAQPTKQPTASTGSSKSSNSSSIIIGGSVGGAAIITGALICALRKNLIRDSLKKYPFLCSESVEQQLGKQSIVELPDQEIDNSISVLEKNGNNISHDIESGLLGKNHSSSSLVKTSTKSPLLTPLLNASSLCKHSVSPSIEYVRESTNHQSSSNYDCNSSPQLLSPTAAAASTAYSLQPIASIQPVSRIGMSLSSPTSPNQGVVEGNTTAQFLEQEICENIYLACLAKVASMPMNVRLSTAGMAQEMREWEAVKHKAAEDVREREEGVKLAEKYRRNLEEEIQQMVRSETFHEPAIIAKAYRDLKIKELTKQFVEAKLTTAEKTFYAIKVKNTKESETAEADLNEAIEKEKKAFEVLETAKIRALEQNAASIEIPVAEAVAVPVYGNVPFYNLYPQHQQSSPVNVGVSPERVTQER